MAHRKRMNGTDPQIEWNQLTIIQTEQLPQVYDVRLQKGMTQCPYTLPRCPGSSRNWNGIGNHFNRQNWGYIIRILEGHPHPFPKYDRCAIQAPQWRINSYHHKLEKCQIREARRVRMDTLQQSFEASRISI